MKHDPRLKPQFLNQDVVGKRSVYYFGIRLAMPDNSVFSAALLVS